MIHKVEGYSLDTYREYSILDYAIRLQDRYNCFVEFVGDTNPIKPWADSCRVTRHKRAELHDMVYALSQYRSTAEFLIYLQGVTARDLTHSFRSEPTDLELLQSIIYNNQVYLLFTAESQNVVDTIIGPQKRKVYHQWA